MQYRRKVFHFSETVVWKIRGARHAIIAQETIEFMARAARAHGFDDRHLLTTITSFD